MEPHECQVSKTCNVCKHDQPIENFGRNKNCKDGRLCICKPCMREKRRNLKESNPVVYARQLEASRQVKQRLGKAHLKESINQWRKENGDHVKEYAKTYYNEKGKQKIYADRAVNPDAHAKYSREWRNLNPEKAMATKLRGRIGNRFVSWADEEKIAAFYRERKRISDETGIVYHVDHIIPLRGERVSGLHVHNNLQILTINENCRKHNKY